MHKKFCQMLAGNLRRHLGQKCRTCTRAHTHVPTSARQQTVHATNPCVEQQPATSVYVHLPFCKRKCFYCDFPVEAIGRKAPTDSTWQRMHRYVELVCNEIQATAKQGSLPLQTIYFGGGTPSLMPPQLIDKILTVLNDRHGMAANAEITLEADPGTFDVQRLQAYKGLGVNRLSVGVQSFQEDLLQACGRAHSVDDVYRAVQAIHASGITSWSLDLISGLPNLTTSQWQQSLEAAVSISPPHISVYDLQVEEGTPFARRYQPGIKPLPNDDEAAAMYAAASHTLTSAGYEHYEVSNYAKPGHRSRHNQIYWSGQPYYAFGLGASSFLSNRRFSRPKTMKAYTSWVEGFTATAGGSGAVPGWDLPPQSNEDTMLDAIMLKLRTADGLDLNTFRDEYGVDMAKRVLDALRPHLQEGKAVTFQGSLQGIDHHTVVDVSELRPETSEYANLDVDETFAKRMPVVRLSDPDGFLLSNDIISDIFASVSDLSHSSQTSEAS